MNDHVKYDDNFPKIRSDEFLLALTVFSFIFIVDSLRDKIIVPLLKKYNKFVDRFNEIYPEYIVWGNYNKHEKPKSREGLGLPPRSNKRK